MQPANPFAWTGEGIPIFPVQEDKKPYPGFLWKDLASVDPEQVKRWQEQYPDCMWAFSPGMVGWCIVDRDPDGVYDDPTTWSVVTRRGRHFYYRGHLSNTAGKIGPHVDTRGDDGYALIYSTEPPEAYQLQLIPQSIVDKVGEKPEAKTAAPGVELDTPANIAAAISFLRYRAPAIEGQGGDDWTYQTAERLRDVGVSLDRAHELMLTHWNERCVPPWSEDALRVKIENAWNYGQNEAGCMAPTDGVALKAAAMALCENGAIKPRIIFSDPTEEPEDIDWLIPGWLAAGKFHVFGGQAGTGKSTIAFAIAAILSRGGQWADGCKVHRGKVLIWSSEDSWRDTILPRLIAAGADMSMVRHIRATHTLDGDRNFDPATDLHDLSDALASEPDVVLIILDPIVQVVQGDSHKNTETRRGLQPVVDLAERHHIALLGITHFTKNTQGRTPLDRITGSLAFGAQPRVVWGAVAQEENTDMVRVVRIKSNIGPTGGAIECKLLREPLTLANGRTLAEVQRIEWGDYREGSARNLIEEYDPQQNKVSAKKAKGWLHAYLAARPSGATTADIYAAAAAQGISKASLYRAREAMPYLETVPGDTNREWRWRLGDEF